MEILQYLFILIHLLFLVIYAIVASDTKESVIL